MSSAREYPEVPRVDVGAVILDGDRALIVKRGTPPAQGKWSVPGGFLRLGETIEAAVVERALRLKRLKKEGGIAR